MGLTATACGGGSSGLSAGPSSTGAGPAASTPTSSSSTGPTSTLRVTSTVPVGRTVPRGETFRIAAGETVVVAGQGLSLTYKSVASDNRCRPGLQCLVAGDATLVVAAARTGVAPADLRVNTYSPNSATYGGYTVELVDLNFGQPPVATLRVT